MNAGALSKWVSQTIIRKMGWKDGSFAGCNKGADGFTRAQETIGPVKDYPENSKKLQDLLAGLRLNINTDRPTELTSITMTEAVEHYKLHELADCGRWTAKAYSTRRPEDAGVEPMDAPRIGGNRTRGPSKPLRWSNGLRRLSRASFVRRKPLAGGTKREDPRRDGQRFQSCNTVGVHGPESNRRRRSRVLVSVSLQSVNEHLTFSKLKRCICSGGTGTSGERRWCFWTWLVGTSPGRTGWAEMGGFRFQESPCKA